ncbi:MAG: EamA family transporter RarD [Actinomycetota bacterium]
MKIQRGGVAYALAAYGSWGMFPAFWKLLAMVPAIDVLAHRVVWSLVVVAPVVAWRGRWGELTAILASRRLILTLLASTLCISLNWGIFVWAVGQNRVLECSLGYFLNPLVNVALGVAVLGERLRPLQWAAVALAGGGVVVLAIATGTPPWVALVLGVSFGIYGLLRKRAPLAPLIGLAVETGLLVPAALAYLAWRGPVALGPDLGTTAILMAGGIATALPLMWFTAAAQRMPYATLGFFQYLAPTGHFLLAVFAYGEPLSAAHLTTFAAIWAAIAVYLVDSWVARRRSTP